MFGYVDLHIWIFVCLPKPGTRTQQSLRYEFPSGKMHLRILTSIFYMISIPTSLLPLTVTSLRLSADTSKWRTGFLQGSYFHSYGFSPPRAEPQASKHDSKTTRVTIQSPAHRASFGCHLCSPRRKLCHGAIGWELCLCSGPLFKVNGHGYGTSLAGAAGGKACNLQCVRLRTRCGEGQTEGVASCGARSLCFF